MYICACMCACMYACVNVCMYACVRVWREGGLGGCILYTSLTGHTNSTHAEVGGVMGGGNNMYGNQRVT